MEDNGTIELWERKFTFGGVLRKASCIPQDIMTEGTQGGRYIRRLIIQTPHPASFQEDRILQKGYFEAKKLAMRMDESFNLAAYLVRINLQYPSYWSGLVDYIYQQQGSEEQYEQAIGK